MGLQYCMRMFLSIVMLLLLSLSLVPNLVSASSPCNFPAIINFGDSNSDTGGFSALYTPPRPPYGESYFGGPAGRFCDGRLIIDFMAESLGLPYVSAYLDALGSNFTHGANFATASAFIRPQNTSFEQSGSSPINLNVQLGEFNNFHSRSQIIRNQGGIFRVLMPKAEDFSRALYTIDIGQNDLAAGFFENMTTDQVKAYVPDLLDLFKNLVKVVYDQGGRSFWIHNTGPVGCLPYILYGLQVTAEQMDKVGCAMPFNEAAQYFNIKLKEAVAQLRSDLPLAALTYVDIYSLKYALVSQPEKYGFMYPLQVCCGYGGGKYNYNSQIRCGDNTTVNGTKVVVGSCKDPSVRISWDGIHYTQAANKWVFDQIVNGSFSDPPIPLNMACHRD